MSRRRFSLSRIPARAFADECGIMMSRIACSLLIVLALLSCDFCFAASKSARPGPKPIDVAEFLRQIDAELSAYDAQSPALHQAVAATSRRMATGKNPRLWQRPAALLQQHARNIRTIARK